MLSVTCAGDACIRLASNGLGCEDWPGCYGFIGSPSEYTAVDSFTDAQPHKQHGLARSFHRLAASVLGLFIIIILAISWRQ